MKCSVVSLSSPHAEHRALFVLPKRKRYPLSGACPTLSWNIRLAIRHEILWSLVSAKNFLDAGKMISGALNFLYRSDDCHSAFQISFSISLCFCFEAEQLYVCGRYRGANGSRPSPPLRLHPSSPMNQERSIRACAQEHNKKKVEQGRWECNLCRLPHRSAFGLGLCSRPYCFRTLPELRGQPLLLVCSFLCARACSTQRTKNLRIYDYKCAR